LFFCSSCVKYYEVAESEFPQGEEQEDKREVVHNNLRSVAVYDQYQTQALFDALWLSDEVRTTYVDMYCTRRGRLDEGKESLLRRQLEENRHWISFYILTDIRDNQYLGLNEKNALWTVYLEVPRVASSKAQHKGLYVPAPNKPGKNSAGKKDTRKFYRVEPERIKEVELDPEYQLLFGHRLNAFKTAYLVTFPQQSIEGNRYLDETGKVSLVFSAPFKETRVTWKDSDRKERSELKKDADFYWA